MTDSHTPKPTSSTDPSGDGATKPVQGSGADAAHDVSAQTSKSLGQEASKAADKPADKSAPIKEPVKAPDKKPETAKDSKPVNAKAVSTTGLWAVSLLALTVAALAAGGSFVVWRQMDGVRADAQQRVDAVLVQTKSAAAEAQASQALAQALQGRMSVAEAKLGELNLQRTQLEELMLSVSRSRDDTLVQDLESSTRFAVQQSNLMGSPNALIATLQAGIERINRSAQPRLNPVLQAMEADLVRLQEVAGADVPMLVAQLAQLAKSIDALPLRSMAPPLPHTVGSVEAVPADSATTTEPTVAETPAATDGSWLSNTWGLVSAQVQTLWRDWSGVAGQQLSGLVRVRAIDNSDAFLLSPEHAWVLRENLKLRVLNARLALVGAQHDVAAQDLAAVAQSVTQYGEPGATDVQALLEKLQSLQASIQGLQVPMPQSTLSALATAAAGR